MHLKFGMRIFGTWRTYTTGANMAVGAIESTQGAANACWPANAFHNRIQWQSLAEGLAKQFADAACRKAMAAPLAERGAAMPIGKFAAVIESIILPALAPQQVVA
ncbi:hypothetical protein [Comamonas koreensis]|uniref:hypothetical protein n=1 Tax=Comamonas koreensis TaxID=160825 RepID=UPI0015FBDE68|nr:hypothetical protein [Comamonas koreensis]